MRKKQRLIADYNYTYAYDANGNLTNKIKHGLQESENYYYNSENRLVKIEWVNSGEKTKEVFYSYDVLGRRVLKIVNDIANNKEKSERYLYDGNEMIAKLNAENEVLAVYTPSSLRTDDQLSVHVTQKGVEEGASKNEGSFFYLKDALGSNTDIVDAAGLVVQHYAYSAFGKILAIKDNNGNDVTDAPLIEAHFAFTGREWDSESGLYYYRARAYDPNIGRFLQVDPHPGAIVNPITHVNKYIYANNDPINYADPMGTFSFKKAIGIALAVTFPVASFFAINGTDIFEKNFDFSQNDVKNFNTAAIVAAAVAVGVATGGTAAPAAFAAAGGGTLGAVAGFGAGVAVGASFGAVTGGLIGGSASLLQGGSFEQGLISGGSLGLVAGAIGGGFGAVNPELFSLSNASGTFGGFVTQNYISIGAASLVIPFTGKFEFPLPRPRF